MSTLNSQSDLLRSIVFEDKKPSRALLVEAGIDIELLEDVVAQLKPNMDYMRGYRPIESWFTQAGDGIFSRSGTHYLPYPAWLEESGLAGEHPHCISVFEATMRGDVGSDWLPLIPTERDRYEGERHACGPNTYLRYARLRVLLTRKGKWIVWANYPTSVFRIAADPASALALIQELTPSDLRLSTGFYSSPAFEILSRLLTFFRESIEAKQKDVTSEEQQLGKINKTLHRFS